MSELDKALNIITGLEHLAPTVDHIIDAVQSHAANPWEIKPITNAAEHEAALNRITSMMNTEIDKDSPQGRWLDATIDLVYAYESKHYPVGVPGDGK